MQIPSFLENITYGCAFVQYPNGVIVDMRIISYVGYFDTFSPYLFVDEINVPLGIIIHISCCFITPHICIR